MVYPLILIGMLYRHNVAHVFDNTDDGFISFQRTANFATCGIRDVKAILAIFYLLFELVQRCCESLNIAILLPQKMQNEAERSFVSNPGQSAKFIDSILQ